MADTFHYYFTTALPIPIVVIAGPVSFLLFYVQACMTVQLTRQLLGAHHMPDRDDSRIEGLRMLISFTLYFMHLMLFLSYATILDTAFTPALAAIGRAFLWTTCMNMICVGLCFGTRCLWNLTMTIREISNRRAGEMEAEQLCNDVELGERSD